MTQYVGRILHEHPGKPGAEVHDYADTEVPDARRMHGKRLTTYRRLGFTVAPALPPPAMPDRPIPSPGLPVPAIPYFRTPWRNPGRGTDREPGAAWARGQGLEVPDRGRLSSEIWSAYQREHAHAG